MSGRLLILRKAGPLRNGAERGKGSIFHCVEEKYANYGGRALCGQMPAIQWTSREGEQITCPRCRKLRETYR